MIPYPCWGVPLSAVIDYDFTAPDDYHDVRQIRQVGEGVTVDDHNVRDLCRFEGADLVGEIQVRGSVTGQLGDDLCR